MEIRGIVRIRFMKKTGKIIGIDSYLLQIKVGSVEHRFIVQFGVRRLRRVRHFEQIRSLGVLQYLGFYHGVLHTGFGRRTPKNDERIFFIMTIAWY